MKKCYLCGVELTKENRSKDHAPPRGVFPEVLPPKTNLITSPCCLKCNQSFTEIDEDFVLGISATAPTGDGHTIFCKVFSGTAKRRSAALSESAVIGKLKMPDGEVAVPTHQVDKSSINPVLARITKGILLRQHRGYDYRNDEFSFNYLLPTPAFAQVARIVTSNFPHHIVVPKVFEYWGGLERERKRGAWLYNFFDRAYFLVRHRRPEARQ
jgi:hypothetical protein